MENRHGVSDVYLSIPGIVNRNGIERQLEIDLYEEEEARLRASADKLKKEIKKLDI